MTAAQLQWFLSDMQEKLQVWSSQEARDANTYLAETFAVASPAYTRIIRRKLPDVLAMTAAQVDRQLAIFAAKHQSMLEMQKIFQQSTQQEIAYNEQQILAIREEHEHALDRAESAAAAWASRSNNFTPARDYYPWVGDQFNNGVGFYGGYGGLGWGGGFF